MVTVKLAEWIAALRSGEYNQCTSYLHCGNSYCCLGVYADLSGKNWRESDDEDEEFDSEIIYYYIDEDTEMQSLLEAGLLSLEFSDNADPDLVSRWENPKNSAFLLADEQEWDNWLQSVFTELNDNGASFVTIANWADANFKDK